MLTRCLPVLFVLPIWIATGTPVTAQTVTVAGIIEGLNPKNTGPVTRSLKQNGAARGIRIDGPIPQEVDLPRVDITVNFELDSARLTTDTMLTLRAVGMALAHPSMDTMQIQLAGHTSAEGSDAHNMDLSQRRAQAVREHLTAFYSIAPDRLIAVGYGETQLLYPQIPNSELNRRVTIINLDPLTN